MERRKGERERVECEIGLVRGEQRVVGWTEDLSGHGACVRVKVTPPLRVGERVELTFALPDLHGPVSIIAEVRWVSRVDPSHAGLEFARGLRAIETWAMNRLFERLARAHC